MKNLESGIVGNANIIYGGKIGGTISRIKSDEPNVVVRIAELQDKQVIGEVEENRIYKTDFQVNMVFDKIESIDAVMNWLERAKEKLNNQLEGKEW